MTTYNYWCLECKNDFRISLDERSDVACPYCGGETKWMGQTCTAVHGLNKRTSAGYQPVFDRPNPEKDILWTAKKLEEGGKMTDSMKNMIDFKLKKLRSKPPVKPVDYQKLGDIT